MLLSISNISKSFGRTRVIENINLEVGTGELIGITGENGSGKSTLLKVIIGDLKEDAGVVQINGRFGYCPQEITVFKHLTVYENIKYFSAAYGFSEKKSMEKAKVLTEYFAFSAYRNYRVDKLSSGTRQKLNLCLALLHEPDLLILDEPYNGFDWDTYQRFWKYVSTLKESGTSLLVVAHLLTNSEMFDQVHEIKNGTLQNWEK